MTPSYLLRVTECEHGRAGACGDFALVNVCPGGSSVRVEPDYEAALASKAARRYGLTMGALYDIVDAALGANQ